MIHALEPVRYASAGEVETMKPFLPSYPHAGRYVLLIGIRGSLFIEQEGHLYEVGPGHTLLLKKGIKHRGIKPSKPGLSYYWFHFNLDNHRATYLDKKQMDEQIMRFRKNVQPYPCFIHFYTDVFKPQQSKG
ncbi:AraC family ligand binding domain-containing protein [Shouchella clausii]|uniref:AraC family ligand binding domain-containing protein n=2 Tax=Shouchella clausii TaxID=79880 RepID=UPI0012FE0AE0|nr:AraC family ligand binding domain-containing protein [Shouchella clausii]